MYLKFLKKLLFISISVLCKRLKLSRSQVNRILKKDQTSRRSIDSRGNYVANIDVIKKRAFKSGIAFIKGHVFSTEKDTLSAMVKCIRESKWGRTRKSFENMFRCKDLGKTFRKLEKRDDIIVIKIRNQFLYLYKSKREEQIKKYYHKKGILLREKEKETITTALIFSVITYNKLDKIKKRIRKSRKKGGRKAFPFKAMVNAVHYRFIKKLSSYGKVSNELFEYSELAVALGFDLEQGTPSASCLSRFVQQVGKHIGNNVDTKLAKLLKLKKELKKKGKSTKQKKVYYKRTKSSKRYYVSFDELDDEIKKLNKKIHEYKNELPENGWYLIFADFVSQLISMKIIDGKWVCLDSTHNNTSRKDPNASYGIKRTRKNKDGSITIVKDFYGYKLHIAVDAKTNLPLAITITTGSVPDNKEAPKIIRQLKRHGIFFKAFLADAGYNDKKIYAAVYKYNKSSKFICPLPKNEDGSENLKDYYYDPKSKQHYEITYNTTNGRKLFRLRGPTENINKIIKSDLDMDKPKVQGLRAIESLAYIHCIAILILAIAAKITGRTHLTNQFSKVI